jgi:hypothetical protein
VSDDATVGGQWRRIGWTPAEGEEVVRGLQVGYRVGCGDGFGGGEDYEVGWVEG